MVNVKYPDGEKGYGLIDLLACNFSQYYFTATLLV